jgi:hypothetical protein
MGKEARDMIESAAMERLQVAKTVSNMDMFRAA